MNFDDLLLRGAIWALGLGAVWGALVLVAAVVEVVSEGRWAVTARLGCPASTRRALLAGVSALLAGGGALAAGPVSASPAPFEQAPAGQGFTLPVPTRPTGAAYDVPRQRVEVHPGDSLWRISTRRSPRATTQDLAQQVARTYRANRQTIGADPDLIHPGQRLVIPRQREQNPPPPGPRSETP